MRKLFIVLIVIAGIVFGLYLIHSDTKPSEGIACYDGQGKLKDHYDWDQFHDHFIAGEEGAELLFSEPVIVKLYSGKLAVNDAMELPAGNMMSFDDGDVSFCLRSGSGSATTSTWKQVKVYFAITFLSALCGFGLAVSIVYIWDFLVWLISKLVAGFKSFMDY